MSAAGSQPVNINSRSAMKTEMAKDFEKCSDC